MTTMNFILVDIKDTTTPYVKIKHHLKVIVAEQRGVCNANLQ
jgi:hypothetical protein